MNKTRMVGAGVALAATLIVSSSSLAQNTTFTNWLHKQHQITEMQRNGYKLVDHKKMSKEIRACVDRKERAHFAQKDGQQYLRCEPDQEKTLQASK